MYIAVSVDGYIARPNGDVDWLETEEPFDFGPFNASVDTVLMGHQTYKKSLTFSEDVFGDKDYYVFTKNHLNTKDDRVQFINADPKSFVKQLQQNPGLNIWLMGGGILNASFLNSGVVDELQLFYVPILLGEGIPLFQGNYPQTTLKMVHHKSHAGGLMELKYQVLKK